MVKVSRILFILLSLLFLSNTQTLYAVKKKNQEILKAQELIKQRRFKEARDILAKEYSLNPDDEDLIIKLINKIEDEEGKVGERTQAVTKSLLDNDTKRAAQLLKELDKLKGNFSEKVNDIIKTTGIVNEQVSRLNEFYNYLEAGEEGIINKEFSTSLNNYGNAINIFRLKYPERFDKNFIEYCANFDLLENKLRSSDVTFKQIGDKKNINFEFVVDEYVKMASKISEWIKLEDELINLKKKLQSVDIRSKNSIEYQSYELINFSYIDLTRNSIATYSLSLLKYIFNLLEKYISEMENNNFENKNIVDNLFDLINNKKIENYSNYNLNFNFIRDLYLKRSYININEFLEYITIKNNFYTREQIALVKSNYKIANDYYEVYKKNISDRELQTAEKNLKTSFGYLDGLFKGKDEIAKIIYDYNDIMNTKYYKETYEKYLNLNSNIILLNTYVKNSMKEIEETTYQIKVMLAEANDKYNLGLTNYKKERFEDAKDNFSDANDKYFEVLSKLKDREVERRIESSKKLIDEIEQRFYKKDMAIADKELDNAKKNFYNEKYEEAKKNLDYAESLFTKYDEQNDTINYYRERISSAIRIKSGTKVKPDDPAYDHIVELFKNANDFYNTGRKNNEKEMFETSLNFLGQILVEKPYNEEARFLETKILKETDPINFESRYNSYYEKAMARLDKARTSKSKPDYGDAMLEFQQLLKFEKNTNQINGYINECKKALEFTKKEITVIDKDYANKLANQAKDYYAKGQYKEALDSANNAIAAWDEVTGAKEIRLAAMSQLRMTEVSKLTTENELKLRLAEKAYADSDFERAFDLTKEILSQKGQDAVKVKNLNTKSKAQMERGR